MADESRMHAAWGQYRAMRSADDADRKTAFETAWRQATAAAQESPRPVATQIIKAGVQHLLFVIDAGRIQWRAAYDTRDEAVAELNGLRPDGTSSIHEVVGATTSDAEVFTRDDCIEFAFIVESPHFVSFV